MEREERAGPPTPAAGVPLVLTEVASGAGAAAAFRLYDKAAEPEVLVTCDELVGLLPPTLSQ